MKKSVLLFLLLIYQNSIAHNFRLFEWGVGHLYANAAEIKGMRVDSFTVSGTDTMFYNYFVVDVFPDSNNCYNAFTPSWFGKGVIIHSDSISYIINANDESILIRPLDSIGSMWNMYADSSGYSVKATISNISLQTVNGITDTIKEIILNEFQNNQPINGILNNRILKLSMNHGFAQSLRFLDFPHDSTYFSIDDYLFLTDSNVYNFDIGDTFQYEFYTIPQYFGPWPPPVLPNSRTIVITNKTFLPGNQVQYDVWEHDYFQWVSFDSLMQGHYHDTTEINTYIKIYSTLNTRLFSTMPEEADLDSNGNLLGILTMNLMCSGVQGTYLSENMYFDSSLNRVCTVMFEAGLVEMQYATGLGVTNMDYHIYHQNGSSTINHMTAFHKSFCSGGSIIINNTLEIFSDLSVNIYPNPISDNQPLHISSKKPIRSVTIYDMTGRVVLIKNPGTSDFTLYAGFLNAGIYLCKIESVDGGILVSRITKN